MVQAFLLSPFLYHLSLCFPDVRYDEFSSSFFVGGAGAGWWFGLKDLTLSYLSHFLSGD